MKVLHKFVLIFAAVALVACGDKKKDENSQEEEFTIGDTQSGNTSKTAESSDSSDENVVEITIEGNDQMRFNKDEIKVKAGQTVRITLKHVGSMAKEVMGHNWVLLTQGTEVSAFGQKAVRAKENDYIPEDSSDEIIAHTKMLGGGESDTIEFEAPEAGTYNFLCSFPGHYSVMKGKFIVEE